jgi:hypothetical protein
VRQIRLSPVIDLIRLAPVISQATRMIHDRPWMQ